MKRKKEVSLNRGNNIQRFRLRNRHKAKGRKMFTVNETGKVVKNMSQGM